MSSSISIGNKRNDDFFNGVSSGQRTCHVNQTIAPHYKLRNRWVHAVFGLAVFLIAAASIYDAYLVYEYREGIIEQNPICNWLIRQEPDSVSLFLVAKGVGTAGVVVVLMGLFVFWRRAGITAAISLVVFQAGLIFYLHHSEISRPKTPRPFADLSGHSSEIVPIEKYQQPTQRNNRIRRGFDSYPMKRSFRRGRGRVQARWSHDGRFRKPYGERPGQQDPGWTETY